MLLSEVALTAAGAAGGVWLWNHGHTFYAGAVWLFAAACVAAVVGTALSERRGLRELAGPLLGACLGAGYLFGLGWGLWRLYSAGYSGTAVLVALVGLWCVPLGLAVVIDLVRRRRQSPRSS